MLKYLRDRARRSKGDPDQIQSYRGGYLPQTRRRIEAGLREGDVRCVVSTHALELGIDIGNLDAVVCAGHPGTMASLWQRFGRGGRRQGTSLALLVTSSHPLDQFFARTPQLLVDAPIEEARIDPDNVEILVQHLKCAAFELPFAEDLTFGSVPSGGVQDVLEFLSQHGVLYSTCASGNGAAYHWASDSYPANSVSLRSVGWDNFVIIDQEHDRTIAEMDWRAAHTMLHEQAIYQHEGEQYQVEHLDFDNHKAFIRKVKPDYYTNAMTHTQVSILSEDGCQQLPCTAQLEAVLGEVSVVEKVVGYKKIRFHTHENVGYGEVHLPEMQMHTSAAWFTFPETFVSSLPFARPVILDALRGIGNALHLIASFGLMVDPRDLGHTLGDRGEGQPDPGKGLHVGAGFDPTLFIYDHVPGGIGLAPRIYEERDTFFARAAHMIGNCECSDGCPACVGPVAEAREEAKPGHGRKAVATTVLAACVPTPLH